MNDRSRPASNGMKEFIEHIQKSIYSPEYYRALLTRPASFSWKYYWSFTMLLSVIMTIAISIPVVPRIDRALATATQKVLAYYPPDLVITIAGGKASVNKPEPYTLPLPSFFREGAIATGFTTLLTIDTTHEVSTEQFMSYHSIFWLAKDNLVAGDGARGVSTLLFPPEMNLTVDQAGVKRVLGQLESFTPLVAPGIVLILFFAFLMSFAILLLYLLIDALFILLIGRFLKYNWSYGASYRIGLHAVTLPILFSTLISLVPIWTVSLPLLTALLTLVVVYMNFKDRVVPNAAPQKSSAE